jgi:hypothetical protein
MNSVEKTGKTVKEATDLALSELNVKEDDAIIEVLDSTKRTNEITWEYYLPLAEDTLDWEGRRAKSPYVMTVYAYKGDKCAVYTVDDIEITGTVFDLIHIQPKG